jgi:type I restriction-modification system DNA methylase subunit
MQSKSADVFGRSWVIYQWLSVLHVTNLLYQNLQVPSFFHFKNLLNSATRNFLSKSLNTFDNNTRIEMVDQMKDDVAGVRATTNFHMQVSHKSMKL